jgi:hypothetical protein
MGIYYNSIVIPVQAGISEPAHNGYRDSRLRGNDSKKNNIVHRTIYYGAMQHFT